MVATPAKGSSLRKAEPDARGSAQTERKTLTPCLFRGGALDVVWPQFLALAVIGTILFGVALVRFRETIGQMA